MITNIDINIFDCVAQGIIHQANCQNTMQSGIARQIRERYPEAYEADCKTVAGDIKKLGTFSWVKTHDDKYIYNCYSQFRYGKEQRHTNYEAIYTALSSIKQHAIANQLNVLSLPHNMGCMLGGGSWKIVSSIIEEVFDNSEINMYICKYIP